LTEAASAELVEANEVKGETVEFVAREWFKKFGTEWKDNHSVKVLRRLEKDLFPFLGDTEIKNVLPANLLEVLRRVELRGAIDTAHRLYQNCGQVWRYAAATGRVERDITSDLKGALPPAADTHLAAITEPRSIGELLRNINNYHCSISVKFALRLAPLFFVRPGELRGATWSEFDIDGCLWTIPAVRMKAGRIHVVPLSSQSVSLLRELRTSHSSEYLFPSPNSSTRQISDMALLGGIRRMGYDKTEMTAHGFRALASTNLEQMGFDTRLIELQLAHADSDQVRAAYKRETHLLRLDERKKMMQDWADYLDTLTVGANVLEFKKA
jgi:integrase